MTHRLSLLVALFVGSFMASFQVDNSTAFAQDKSCHAGDARPACCKDGAECCKEGAECCKGQHEGSCCKGGCVVKEVAKLATVKVDNTAQGATLTLTAKKPGDAAKVQELAQRMAKKMGSDAPCPHCHKGEKAKAAE